MTLTHSFLQDRLVAEAALRVALARQVQRALESEHAELHEAAMAHHRAYARATQSAERKSLALRPRAAWLPRPLQ